MKSRQPILLLVLLIAAMLLPACAPTPAADCISEEIFCVGLVTDTGKINDQSFNQSAWEAVQQAENDLGAHIQYIETIGAQDYAQNIALLAEQGFDVVITIGPALGDATTAAATNYPETDFIGVEQPQAKAVDGVTGLSFPDENAGFLVGALATMMSSSHKIGVVCGADAAPTVWRYVEGYRAGAAFADQLQGTATDVTIVHENSVSSSQDSTDPAWGANAARSMIDAGVDTIFGCGGRTGNGAITAAAQSGVYAIGADIDQYLMLPDAAPRLLSSAVKLITPGVFQLIKLSREGQFPSGNYLGESGYAPYHDLEHEVPVSVKKMMEQIRAGLLNGSIKINVAPLSD
jgi:basic membrane protein A